MIKMIVLACSALLVLHCAFSVRGADPCVLDGFDLTELERGKFWNVTLTKHECLVPRGYTTRDIANCTVYFSICKPLPRDICVGQINSSTCQVVKTKNGTTHYFDIGNYQEFKATGGTDDVGFATIRHGSPSSSALCNNTFATIMSWRCEPSSQWNHTRNNATVFVENSQFNIFECLLEVQFNYSGACYEVPTLPPNRCQLDPYHLTGLKREGYYFATLPNSTCLTKNATSCTIYFSFCQGLPLTTGGGCYEAAVCQTGMGPGGEFSYSMGQFDKETRFLDARHDFAAGGFYIDVEGGDTACDNTDIGISTQIVLVCDPLEIWTQRDLSHIVHVEQQPNCVYTITLPYAGACLLPASTAVLPTPSRSTTGHHPTSTNSGSSTSTKVPPHPTPTSGHNTGTKSTSGTHKTSTRGPVHTPTTGPPPSHHTTPEKHPTSPENKHTTQPTAKPNSHKIAGLTAGLVIFVLISVALLVLFIIAAFYIYKQRRQGGEYERLRSTND